MNASRRSSKSDNAQIKADDEKRIFQDFLSALGWPTEEVINKDPPAPDILYIPPGKEATAFELAELADQNFSQALARGNHEFSNFQSPIERIIKQKWNKAYKSESPIHLLLYTANRAALWDEWAENELRSWCNAFSTDGPFYCVWYWGSGAPKRVWERKN